MFFCTLTGALAQLLIKAGAGKLGVHITLTQVVHNPLLIIQFGLGVLTNYKLFLGYSLYGVNTFLIVYALKGRELSRLYPILALTFVWVTVLSIKLLGEHINTYSMLGVVLIVGGVSVLGGGGKSKETLITDVAESGEHP